MIFLFANFVFIRNSNSSPILEKILIDSRNHKYRCLSRHRQPVRILRVFFKLFSREVGTEFLRFQIDNCRNLKTFSLFRPYATWLEAKSNRPTSLCFVSSFRRGSGSLENAPSILKYFLPSKIAHLSLLPFSISHS